MNFRRAISLLSLGLFLLIATRFHSQDAVATASIEGVVVQAGTNTPIPGVDVELSRVEGTAAVPAAPGSSEAFAAIIAGTGGPGTGGATPPPVIAGEIRYAKSGTDGKFSFTDLSVIQHAGGNHYAAFTAMASFRCRQFSALAGIRGRMDCRKDRNRLCNGPCNSAGA